MKISQVLDKLIGWHAPIDRPHTADTVKIGNPDQECTGIAVTCYCSVDVVRKAAEQKCNLIICHEPLFYGDDEANAMKENDPVYQGKRALLEKYGIVVWRDHDHMHGPGKPHDPVHTEIDHIYHGIMKELNWDAYVTGETTKPLFYTIPETTAGELARLFMDKFGLTGLRLVGDPAAKVRKVFICEHVQGRPQDAEIVAKAADADVMIPLEIVDWTLSEYVRDAYQLGIGKAIIEMGHFNTEELGMKHMAKWLPDVIGNEAPVTYIQSGDSFRYMLR